MLPQVALAQDMRRDCAQGERQITEPNEEEKKWIRTILAERHDGDVLWRTKEAFGIESDRLARYLREDLAQYDDLQEYMARRSELKAVYGEELDKEARQRLVTSINAYDSMTWGVLEYIVRIYGWPSPERVGGEHAPDLFLLHPPSPERTENLTCLLKAEVQAGRLDAEIFANMVDKMRWVYKKPPMYGVMRMGQPDGTIALQPVDDLDAVNRARAEIGLLPRE